MLVEFVNISWLSSNLNGLLNSDTTLGLPKLRWVVKPFAGALTRSEKLFTLLVQYPTNLLFFSNDGSNNGREGEATRNLIAIMPDLERWVNTTDALHLQDETITQVFEDKNGHLLVGLKGNRSRLLNKVV